MRLDPDNHRHGQQSPVPQILSARVYVYHSAHRDAHVWPTGCRLPEDTSGALSCLFQSLALD